MNVGVVAVVLLLVLAGAAVYGISQVARSSGGAGTGAGGVAGGTEGQRLTASGVLAEAEPLILDGKWDEAVTVLRRGVDVFPDEQELRLSLARALGGQKDWGRSLEQFEAALSIGPESAALNAEAATTANAAGALDRAVELFSRAKQLEPTNPRHPLYLAMVQIKQGGAEREREAMVNLVTATVLNPDLAEAWGVMGELALRSNQLGLAEQHLEKARRLQPESFKWRLAQAKMLKRSNRPAEAVDCLLNLPEAQRFDAQAVPVIADSLKMLRQEARRGEYLRAAGEFARARGDGSLSAVVAAQER